MESGDGGQTTASTGDDEGKKPLASKSEATFDMLQKQ